LHRLPGDDEDVDEDEEEPPPKRVSNVPLGTCPTQTTFIRLRLPLDKVASAAAAADKMALAGAMFSCSQLQQFVAPFQRLRISQPFHFPLFRTATG